MRLDEKVFARGVEELTAAFPPLHDIVVRWGTPQPWWREEGYATLVLMILEQQVSIGSAQAALRRLTAAAGDITPRSIVALGEAGIRDAGITRQKTATCLGLAGEILDGTLDLDGIALLDDHDAIAELTRLKGIGPWTAQVYLMTALRRGDLFPAADRALVVAAFETGLLDHEPAIRELAQFSTAFRPYRSVAAWLLWHGYLCVRGREAPPRTAPAR